MATPHARPDPAMAAVTASTTGPAAPESVDELFHRLNNLLGIVLVNAELLETKAADETTRSRASQVVSSVLDALTTARRLRDHVGR